MVRARKNASISIAMGSFDPMDSLPHKSLTVRPASAPITKSERRQARQQTVAADINRI